MTSADFHMPRMVNSDCHTVAPAEDETPPGKSNFEPQFGGSDVLYVRCGFCVALQNQCLECPTLRDVSPVSCEWPGSFGLDPLCLANARNLRGVRKAGNQASQMHEEKNKTCN